VETGQPLAARRQTYTDVFGRAVARLAETRPNLVAVTAAMPDGVGLTEFRKNFPGRMFDVGIAEAHAVTFAAGLAKNGLRPVVAIYSTFLQRAYDQILHDVCIQNLPVVLAIDRAGVVGPDGETHQGLYDLSFLSHLPNLTLLAPMNGQALEDMLAFALDQAGPVAIRYPKAPASDLYGNRAHPLDGRAALLEPGKDLALVSVGAMMEEAHGVWRGLREAGLRPALYDARFIKPIHPSLPQALAEYVKVYVLEENAARGGFFSALVSDAAQMSLNPGAYRSFAFPDRFIEQGTRREVLARYGLDAAGMLGRILGEGK
jgi:1-deoxy-D-xylulose-5-phosphate synthase